jgi:hypothetical protein
MGTILFNKYRHPVQNYKPARVCGPKRAERQEQGNKEKMQDGFVPEKEAQHTQNNIYCPCYRRCMA